MRAAGAVPATIGVLDGASGSASTRGELERFGADARKVGPRDLAACAVQGALGATTVGGTLAVCRAGRDPRSWRPAGSAASTAASRAARRLRRPRRARAHAGASSSRSGVKSLLDVPATVELLETLGVPVLGYRTDTLPLFYAARGGPPVSARVEIADEAAAIATRALGARRRRRCSSRARPTRASTTSSR